MVYKYYNIIIFNKIYINREYIELKNLDTLNLFSILYYKKLSITDDDEFFSDKDIFSIKEKIQISQVLLPIMFNLYTKKCSNYQKDIRYNITLVVKELYFRNT